MPVGSKKTAKKTTKRPAAKAKAKKTTKSKTTKSKNTKAKTTKANKKQATKAGSAKAKQPSAKVRAAIKVVREARKAKAKKKAGKKSAHAPSVKPSAAKPGRKPEAKKQQAGSQAAPASADARKNPRLRSQPVEVQEIDVKVVRQRKSRMPAFSVRSYGKKPKKISPAELLSTLTKTLGKAATVASKNLPDTVVETGIFTIFALGGTASRTALEAVKRLRDTFPDWNEFRVSDTFEFVEVLEDLNIGDLYDRCEQALEFVREVYKDQNAVDLEFLREREPAERLQLLNRYPALGAGLALHLALALQDFSGVLFDYSWARVAHRVGLIPRSGSPKTNVKALAKLYTKEADLATVQLNMIRLGEEICTPKNPLCKSCYLVLHCPSRKV